MGTKLSQDVRAFHMKFGHPVRERPAVPSDDEVKFRLRLITEEYLELLDAATDPEHPANLGLRETVGKMLRHLITEVGIKVDLPEFVDALGDMDFINEGTRLVCGVDGSGIAAEISHANLSKDPVYVKSKDAHHQKPDPLAKPTKPPGWKPPNIEGELRRQGWRP